MNGDDPLLGAFEALRDMHDGKADGLPTRQRVLAGARRHADARHRLLLAFIPVAATLLVSVAWAAEAGRLGTWSAAVRNVLEPSRSVPALGLPPRVSASLPLSHATGPLGPPIVELEVHAAVPDESVNATGPSVPVVHASNVPPPAIHPPVRHVPERISIEDIESPPKLRDTEDDLFATAQTAHFGGHDPVSALVAWDAYLGAFPHGRFELEARYNRATTLLRLGRDDEARAALLPFLEGQYRQREARLLLQALGEHR